MLVGLGLNAAFGWWWADPLAVAFVAFDAFDAFDEGRKHWRADNLDRCC